MTTRYQDNAELRGHLAAEYALGTLRGAARARFEKLLRGDSTLREEVTFWHERFSEFATRLKPVAPRDVVWAALEKTIAQPPKVTELRAYRAPPAAKPAAPSRVIVWQVWAAAATLAAVALGVGLQREQAKTGALNIALEAAQNKPMPYVAVLKPAGGDAQWAITLHPEEKVMRVVLSGRKMPADTSKRSLELWMLDSKGTPHSLGLLPLKAGQSKDMPLAEIPVSERRPTITLAISEEPRGGSPTGLPTGKVLGAVPAVKPI
ncbi:MAG: anti-sigma factor [Pseudomonadota bacterium]